MELDRNSILIVAEIGIDHKRDATLSQHQGTFHHNAIYLLQYLCVVELIYANIDGRLYINRIEPRAKQVSLE